MLISTDSMPTKCIDQMPPPKANAACDTRTLRRRASSTPSPLVSRSEVNDAMIATAIDAMTSDGT